MGFFHVYCGIFPVKEVFFHSSVMSVRDTHGTGSRSKTHAFTFFARLLREPRVPIIRIILGDPTGLRQPRQLQSLLLATPKCSDSTIDVQVRFWKARQPV
jgi:hypothetical protein